MELEKTTPTTSLTKHSPTPWQATKSTRAAPCKVNPAATLMRYGLPITLLLLGCEPHRPLVRIPRVSYIAYPDQGASYSLTTRDWIAGQALGGLIANRDHRYTPSESAAKAYALADAMLAEREKESKRTKKPAAESTD